MDYNERKSMEDQRQAIIRQAILQELLRMHTLSETLVTDIAQVSKSIEIKKAQGKNTIIEQKNLKKLKKKLKKYDAIIQKIYNIAYQYYCTIEKYDVVGNYSQPKHLKYDISCFTSSILRYLEEDEKVIKHSIIQETAREIPMAILRTKMNRNLKKIKKYPVSGRLPGSPKPVKLTDVAEAGDIFSIFAESQPKTVKILDTEGHIKMEYCRDIEKKELLLPHLGKDNDFLNRLINSLTSSMDEVIKLRNENIPDEFKYKAQGIVSIYRDCIKHHFGAKVIEYIIPQLNHDPVHSSRIRKLKSIAKKHNEIARKLKKKADKEYLKLQEEMAKKNINLDKLSPEKTTTIDLVGDLTPQKEEQETKEKKEKKEKMAEIEIIRLSRIYRAEYIGEKIKKTELGELSYSEYLKRVHPDAKEVIAYVENEENKAETIYEAYIKDRAKRASKNQPIITFKEFVKITTGKEYNPVDIELTPEMETNLKKMKAL